MTTFAPRTAQSEVLAGASRISAKKLREISLRAIASQTSTGEEGVIALTHYNNVLAYIVPAETAEKAFRAQQASVSFLQDWIAVASYVETALTAGIPIRNVLDTILKDDSEGEVAVDFAGLGRLLSGTPIRFDLDEDGQPIARTEFKVQNYVAEESDEADPIFSRS